LFIYPNAEDKKHCFTTTLPLALNIHLNCNLKKQKEEEGGKGEQWRDGVNYDAMIHCYNCYKCTMLPKYNKMKKKKSFSCK
jgi:hypothetical protein